MIARTLSPDISPELSRKSPMGTELLIVDEADRLKTAGLELVREYFDSGNLGVVLIGMPVCQRQLARYPQLYSRVGFAHHYRPLDSTDIPPVLAQYWQDLGMTYAPHRSSDAESVVTIVRITGGNFRLVNRLGSPVGARASAAAGGRLLGGSSRDTPERGHGAVVTST